jgi:hypothetical protein
MPGIKDILIERERERQRKDADLQRRLAEQMLDIEFEMDIAPYLNYQSDKVDAAKTRFHGFVPDEQGRRPTDLPLRGFIGSGGKMAESKGYDDPNLYMKIRHPEYGTVPIKDSPSGYATAVGDNATPFDWAHEFRHLQMPYHQEDTIRVLDAYNAQNEKDWQKAVESWTNYMPFRRGASEDALDQTLRYLEEQSKKDRELSKRMVANPYWRRRKGKK